MSDTTLAAEAPALIERRDSSVAELSAVYAMRALAIALAASAGAAALGGSVAHFPRGKVVMTAPARSHQAAPSLWAIRIPV
mgnify:CR=1 FL=1